jgi:hypothetical protein
VTDQEWLQLEIAAREQAVADSEAMRAAPLAYGQPIAWNRMRRGETVGLTEIHRVGDAPRDIPFTACGFSIPLPDRWFPLSPAMIRTMAKCKYCEAEVARVAREKAA